MDLAQLTFWEHEVTFKPKGLVMLYAGLVIAVGLIILINTTAKKFA